MNSKDNRRNFTNYAKIKQVNKEIRIWQQEEYSELCFLFNQDNLTLINITINRFKYFFIQEGHKK